MSGRSICLHLLVVLSLLLSSTTGGLAKDDVIVVHPGVLKIIPGPKKPKATKRRNPRVGTRRTEYRLAGVSVERGVARSEKRKRSRKKAEAESEEKDDRRTEEIEGLEVERKENAIHIKADDGAAGQLFKLTALLNVRTAVYKRISRDEFGKKIQPYNSWADLPDREHEQEYTLAVTLGTMPHALVPNGREMTIALSDALGRVSVRRGRRPQAEVKLEDGNRLRIIGRKPGDTEFEFRYELAGKKLAATLPVRVLEKNPIASISVKEGRNGELGTDEIDELFGLRQGAVLRVDAIEDASIAQIAFDDYRLQVKGLKPGTTRAQIAYTGEADASGKGRKRVRCQLQVPLDITVK